DRRGSSRFQAIRKHRKQAIKVCEFAVHADAKRLECPGGRMQLRAGGALESEIPRFADNRRKRLCGGNRRDLSTFYDQFGDLRCICFIAESQERFGKLALA